MELTNLVTGMLVEDNFAVLKVESLVASSGKKYMKAELAHKSGSINAKVWEENIQTAPLVINKVYRISGKVDAYRGVLGIVITQAWLIEDEKIENHLKSRKSIILDIETAGENFANLDEWNQKYLLDRLQINEKDKEIAKEKTALYPIYGKVVAIGMLNPVTNKGKVLVWGKIKSKNKDNKNIINLDSANYSCEIFSDEIELLSAFWEIVIKFEHFITFNGNNFDWPFLLFRSAINKIKVPLEINRSKEQQTDLMEKFKSGNVYSLEALCRAFNIVNPKEKGVSGLHVSNLFEEGKIEDIANYVSRDVDSTASLYDIWKTYMAGKVVL